MNAARFLPGPRFLRRLRLRLNSRRGGLPARFLGAERGVAILEFALIAPFLLMLLLATFEVSRYIQSARRIGYVATSIAEVLAQTAATPGTVDYTDLQSAVNSTVVTFPGVLSDSYAQGKTWSSDIQISVAGVQFTPTATGCTTGCTYIANVVWNYRSSSAATLRTCGVPLTASTDTSAPSKSSLPTDVFGAGSLIVVDVVFTYRPLVAQTLLPNLPLTIARSFYIQPRYASLIKYSVITGDPGLGTECPGY